MEINVASVHRKRFAFAKAKLKQPFRVVKFGCHAHKKISACTSKTISAPYLRQNHRRNRVDLFIFTWFSFPLTLGVLETRLSFLRRCFLVRHYCRNALAGRRFVVLTLLFRCFFFSSRCCFLVFKLRFLAYTKRLVIPDRNHFSDEKWPSLYIIAALPSPPEIIIIGSEKANKNKNKKRIDKNNWLKHHTSILIWNMCDVLHVSTARRCKSKEKKERRNDHHSE